MVKGFGPVEALLRKRGKFIGSSSQHDVYYTDMTKYKTYRGSFVLRVRDTGKSTFLTYKGHVRPGVYDEHETGIDDADAANMMLLKSGLERFVEIRKNRKTYRFNGAEVNLDAVKGLGNFVEIEIISKQNADARLGKVVKQLGLEHEKTTRQGYVAQLLKKTNSKYSKYMKY